MKAKILLGFLLVVIFALSAYILFIYSRHIPKNTISIEHIRPEVARKEVQHETMWLQTLQKQSQNYSYPATELKIGLKFKDPHDKTTSNRLIIDHLDDYKFFCLNEVLKQEHIEFAYSQTKNATQIIIFLPEGARKNQILEDLKYYEIQYKLQ
ncbi:hypothetical protein BKH46_04585 [Helicobacter sp. 12S02634-8]|uniref:hypothetical protein n=1 Tax=Helicobacter sp. 12S02634-8 TaxID=1476199 RepID=UPI000BA6699D|nr:hypothetical protein [Helicobacter sp. 12S02634-8]PAF47362.1 hypothetical protein BKH46_04585 [Helicobacter sp. 12S02634-8]